MEITAYLLVQWGFAALTLACLGLVLLGLVFGGYWKRHPTTEVAKERFSGGRC